MVTAGLKRARWEWEGEVGRGRGREGCKGHRGASSECVDRKSIGRLEVMGGRRRRRRRRRRIIKSPLYTSTY